MRPPTSFRFLQPAEFAARTVNLTTLLQVVRLFLAAVLVLFAAPPNAKAQWQLDGIPICDTSGNTRNTWPTIAPDETGGAYICWQDTRNTTVDLYAQRVDASGRIQWQRNGIPVVALPQGQSGQRMINDGAGNVIIAWIDNRSGRSFPYVQKLDMSGQSLWQVNGVQVALTPGLDIALAGDGEGGTFIAWDENGAGQVMGQRLDAFGRRMWGDSGVRVAIRPNEIIYPEDIAAVSDGAKGMIVAWAEGVSYSSMQVYAQRVDSTGQRVWRADGVLLSNTVGSNIGVGCSSDLQGGAIVSWGNLEQVRTYACRVLANGLLQWQPGGVLLGTSAGGGAHRNTSDLHGGAFIGHGIYVQHVDSGGTKLWNPAGVRYTTLPIPGNQSIQTRAPAGGMWNFWTGYPSTEQVFRQWIDASGRVRWTDTGLPVTTARSAYPQATNASETEAIVCWEQGYGTGYARVYAAKIDTNGLVTTVGDLGVRDHPSMPTLGQNYPNPFNGITRISFSIPSATHVVLGIFDTLGRQVQALAEGWREAGEHTIDVDLGQRSSGVYYCRLLAGTSVSARMLVLVK